MQIGFMVEPQVGGTYEELLGLALWAETQGVDTFARSDHYLNMQTSAHTTDALTTLGGLARETTTMKLAVLVTPLTFRHPAVIAKTAATINEMSRNELSGDRFELGIGTGWMEAEHERFGIDLGSLGRRFDRFEEALQYVSAAFGRTNGGFSGEHYTLDDMEVLPGADRLPIIIGGGGMKRTPALAGRYADEYNMFVTDTETLAKRVAVMRAAAGESGRDADEVLVSMVTSTMTAADEAGVAELLAARAAARDMEPDEYRKMLESRSVPFGTPDQLAQHYAALASAGVGRIYLQEFAALDEIDRTPIEAAISVLKSL